jgi:pyruvate dehydrogenase E2 component (dihydrolipoamide acetyltransferase)
LFAIETDKATMDVEAPASGVLRQVSAGPGDPVKALSPIAVIAAPGEQLAGQAAGPAAGAAVAQAAATPGAGAAAALPAAGPDGGAGLRRRIFISPRARRLADAYGVPLEALAANGPEGAIAERDVRAYLEARPALAGSGPAPAVTPVARRMAEQAGIDWRQLAGSGPGRRVSQEDVSRAVETAHPAPAIVSAVNEAVETIPLRGVRAVIAGRMAQSSATTARVTLTAEADASALVALRQQLTQDGVTVSYNDMFLYILGRALRDHPNLNASLEGDAIQVWRRIHIGVAVDTERGLLVPVVRDADTRGLLQLAKETKELVERARAGQSSPAELSGGTFTLTNLGMYGIDAFTPVINLPECAVLGVGRIKQRPVMVADRVVGRHMVWLSLSIDHRLVDGAPAARFLQRVVQLTERPHLLLA